MGRAGRANPGEIRDARFKSPIRPGGTLFPRPRVSTCEGLTEGRFLADINTLSGTNPAPFVDANSAA